MATAQLLERDKGALEAASQHVGRGNRSNYFKRLPRRPLPTNVRVLDLGLGDLTDHLKSPVPLDGKIIHPSRRLAESLSANLETMLSARPVPAY